MADEKLATPAMVLAGESYERKQLAREVAERAKNPLNEAKREGGFFLRADGTPVDANDVEIPADKLTDEEKASIASHKGVVEEKDEAEKVKAAKKK